MLPIDSRYALGLNINCSFDIEHTSILAPPLIAGGGFLFLV
jgi:hypothetical protein